MDLNNILDLILGQGIWCALFVYLFYSQQKENKTREEKADRREEKLLSIINEQGTVLTEIRDSLEGFNVRIDKIEDRLDDIEDKMK